MVSLEGAVIRFETQLLIKEVLELVAPHYQMNTSFEIVDWYGDTPGIISTRNANLRLNVTLIPPRHHQVWIFTKPIFRSGAMVRLSNFFTPEEGDFVDRLRREPDDTVVRFYDLVIQGTLRFLEAQPFDMVLLLGVNAEYLALMRLKGSLTLNSFHPVWTPRRLKWVTMPYTMVDLSKAY